MQDRQWQFAELFMRNLSLAPEQGVTQGFLDEVAAVVPKLDVTQWEEDVESGEAEELAAADEQRRPSARSRPRRRSWSRAPNGVEVLEDGPDARGDRGRDRTAVAVSRGATLRTSDCVLAPARGVAQPGSAHRSGR